MYSYICKATKDVKSFKYINIGPSWAWSAFATMHQHKKLFNYADVWNIPYYDLSMPAKNNETLIKELKNFLEKNPNNKPVIWFWPGLSSTRWAEIHDKDDWKERYRNFTVRDLKIIDNIGNKILIIGAHSDADTLILKTKNDFTNITFHNLSIQKFIAKYCNSTNLDFYFDFECAWHAINASKNPSKSLVNAVYEGTQIWQSWQEKSMFVGMAHPTEKAVSLYALNNIDYIKTWLKCHVDIE